MPARAARSQSRDMGCCWLRCYRLGGARCSRSYGYQNPERHPFLGTLHCKSADALSGPRSRPTSIGLGTANCDQAGSTHPALTIIKADVTLPEKLVRRDVVKPNAVSHNGAVSKTHCRLEEHLFVLPMAKPFAIHSWLKGAQSSDLPPLRKRAIASEGDERGHLLARGKLHDEIVKNDAFPMQILRPPRAGVLHLYIPRRRETASLNRPIPDQELKLKVLDLGAANVSFEFRRHCDC